MTCWKCGAAIDLATGQKVNSRDTCPQCDSDLRVCRNCTHFEPSAHNECREVMAEWVRFKDRGNYCDYFSPATVVNSSAPKAQGKSFSDDARKRFDALFKN